MVLHKNRIDDSPVGLDRVLAGKGELNTRRAAINCEDARVPAVSGFMPRRERQRRPAVAGCGRRLRGVAQFAWSAHFLF